LKQEEKLSPCRIALLKGIILASAIESEEIYGYEVYKKILKLTEGKWKPSLGTIYRILNELSEQGLLSRIEETKRQRPIIYYKITDKGIKEFLNIARAYLERISLGLTIVLDSLKKIKEQKGKLDPETENKLKKIHKKISEVIH